MDRIVRSVLFTAAWFCRSPLLRGLAGFLIVNQSTEDVNVVCLSSLGYVPDGIGGYEVVSELRRKGSHCKVLLIGPAPGRLVEAGIVPSLKSLSRRVLAARGVGRGEYSVLCSEGRSDPARPDARRLVARSPRRHRALGLPAVPQRQRPSDVGRRSRARRRNAPCGCGPSPTICATKTTGGHLDKASDPSGSLGSCDWKVGSAAAPPPSRWGRRPRTSTNAAFSALKEARREPIVARVVGVLLCGAAVALLWANHATILAHGTVAGRRRAAAAGRLCDGPDRR